MKKYSDLNTDNVIHIKDDLLVLVPEDYYAEWHAYFIDKAGELILAKSGSKAEVKAFTDKEKSK